MKDEIIKKVINILSDPNNFISDIKIGKGLDAAMVNHFIFDLQILAKEIKKEKNVDKQLVYYLIDIVPSLLLAANDYSEEEQMEILELIQNISDSIVNCFD